MAVLKTGSKQIVCNVGWADAARKIALEHREAEKKAKQSARFAVFLHHEQGQPTGRGHVVRPVTEEGKAVDQYNYGNAQHTGQIFKREGAAQKVADQMNGL